MPLRALVPKNKRLIERLWDLWCAVSIIGIWPRYIEPKLLSVSKLEIKLAGLPLPLEGLKILQFSDLHFQSKLSKRFLSKLSNKINALNPDIIVFCGDFLCHSKLEDHERLKQFLNSLKAPKGFYAVLGNHDYEQSVTLNANGEFDVQQDYEPLIKKGFKRLFTSAKVTGRATEQARAIKRHKALCLLLKESQVKLLHNTSTLISIGNSYLNICGLGEHCFNDVDIEATFQNYKNCYPGIILLHNPDAVPLLKNCPGHIVLCGHTHGGQVNLPWMWKKFIPLQYRQFKKGLTLYFDKWIYTNRGVGSCFTFRWFALPELLLLTLKA